MKTLTMALAAAALFCGADVANTSTSAPLDVDWTWMPLGTKAVVNARFEAFGIDSSRTKHVLTLRSGAVKRTKYFNRRLGKDFFILKDDIETLKIRYNTTGWRRNTGKDVVRIKAILFDRVGNRLGAPSFDVP